MDLNLLIIALLIISSALTLFLAIYTILRIRKPESLTYALLMVCISLYSFGYAIEFSGTTIEEIFKGIYIEYIGIVFTPALWLILSMQYRRVKKDTIRFLIPFLLLIPVSTLIILFTNNSHNLFYSEIGIKETSLFTVIQLGKGLWYYLFQIFNTLAILAGVLLFLTMIVRSTGYLRKQAALVFSASLIPWFGDILYLTGNSFYGIDHTPFFLTIIGPILLFALFRYKMLDIMPIARSIVFQEMKNPVYVFDMQKRLIDSNKAAKRLTKTFQILEKNKQKAFTIDGSFLHQVQNNKDEREPILLVEQISENIHYFNANVSTFSSRTSILIGYLLTLQDITREKNLIEKLHCQAVTDELTGLHNRRNLMNLCRMELAKIKRTESPLSLLLLDIDHFKEINDSYGHEGGDIALKLTAETLSKQLRLPDILGRYGGEEFMVALPDTDEKTSFLVAERLRAAIEKQKVQFNAKSFSFTVSIGSLTLNHNSEENELEKAISAVDKALYKAKELGRNRVVSFRMMKEL